MSEAARPWYGDGLQFSCTACGKCCKGPRQGYVWVDDDEIRALAEAVGLSLNAFGRRYLRRVGKRLSLVENADHDCVFWQDGQGCTVYKSRPNQCREFPFWPEVLESPEAWQDEQDLCPGIGQGRHYSLEDIRRIRAGVGHGTDPGRRAV